tara:strand:- start:18446 stop:18673 length:228 start_codon:yes stop_codon:yes gene_type:complete
MVKIIIKLPTVKKRCGLSRSSIYKYISENTFPKPISLGGRSVGWLESEIEGWVEQQISLSRGEHHSSGGNNDERS